MKTLTIALVAASLAAAPAAYAQSANTAARDASATVAAPADAKWKVGERIPGAYASSSRFKADVAALNLPKAPPVHRWIHVETTAYLVNNQNDVIVQIVGVSAKN
jgi:Ni/Co efflux regulator RcnB